MDYTSLKKQVMEKYFSRLNPMQRQAIFRINGALLIIAGAGSGKTTVLCNRVANMLLFGDAYNSDKQNPITDNDIEFCKSYLNGEIDSSIAAGRLSQIFGVDVVPAWQILTVTFTNKAASELKERLSNMGADTEGIWAATFHSACVRILRTDITALDMGYSSNFTIYDSDDSLKIIRDIMKEMNIDIKAIAPKSMHSLVSRAKDNLITPDEFSDKGQNGHPDVLLATAKQIYTEYQKRLRRANALDFDDIIMLTVKLFSEHDDVLSRWKRRFRYIMVDEYQDTNTAQYKLVSLLAGENGNLCVVGDEDQSIYRFRGATIENILSFEEEFGAHVIKLEQNYRSTSNILEAANAVISNNLQHREKNLWSDLGAGEKIHLQRFSGEEEESMYVVDRILEGIKQGKSYSDHVILYRNNAQSRNIEVSLAKSGIPYRIIGGVRFYERKEIKDIIAYLSVLNNNFDPVRFSRIINTPTRGIGQATQDEILRIANGMGMSPIEVMLDSEQFPTLARKSKQLTALGESFYELSHSELLESTGYIINEILDTFGYREMLKKEGADGEVRLENIYELKSNLISFVRENPESTMSDFLEQIALVSDMDSFSEEEDRVVLMTMHSAKGLEFDTVIVIGAEENIFPSYMSMSDPISIEEERRLAYVAITRAKRSLYFTCAKRRMLYGQTVRNKVSRFVTEIPPKYMEYSDKAQPTESDKDVKFEEYPTSKKTGYLQQNYNRTLKSDNKPSAKSKEVITYSVGERVHHSVFGDGTVLQAKPMGGDYLLEIAFDNSGTKKVAAKFSKMEKI